MENLKKIRKAKGLKQKELAELVGVSESSISQYESGKKTPSFEIALKLAEALSDLLYGIVVNLQTKVKCRHYPIKE